MAHGNDGEIPPLEMADTLRQQRQDNHAPALPRQLNVSRKRNGD
jgi:hypothetical protein